MKNTLCFVLALVLITGCSIGGSDSSGSSTVVDPLKDTSLSSLTVNGEQINLENGVSDYTYAITASADLGTLFTLSATLNNANASITGVGSKSITNPPVAVPVQFGDPSDPMSRVYYEVEQTYTEALFKLSVTSEDGSTTKEYNITVLSAPAWVEANMHIPGDPNRVLGKELVSFLHQDWVYFYKFNIPVKAMSSQKVYLPFPEKTDIRITGQMFIDKDNDGNFSFEDVTRYTDNYLLNLGLDGKSNMGDLYFYDVNRIKVINIPAEFTGLDIYPDIYAKDNSAHTYRTWGQLNTDRSIFTGLNTRHGNYDLYFSTGKKGIDDIIYLGEYSINGLSDIVIDLSGKTVQKVADFGLAINYDDLSTGIIEFSEPVNVLTFENSFQMKNAETNTIISYSVSWNVDNTIVTIIPDSPLETGVTYHFSIDKNLEAVSGKKLFISEQFYYTDNTL